MVVKGYHFAVTVVREYWIDKNGEETTFPRVAAKVMLELDWGPEFGKSKVALEDENRIWYRYRSTN